ncbi:MAG: hypothetical protein ACREO9_03720, partial [Lysobacterales bacterium]
PAYNGIFVRDNFDSGSGSQDGYSFFMNPNPENDGYGFLLITRGPADAFAPPIVNVTGNPLPVEPDPRTVLMATHVFQVFQNPDNGDFLEATLTSVGIPTYGTSYSLTGRHCLYPDHGTGSKYYGDDCVVGGGPPSNLVGRSGGGAGQGDFSETFTPELPELDTNDAPTGTIDQLGTVFGAIAFGGPGGLPVLRGSSHPTQVGRTNANLLAYQEYIFLGADGTPLQLVVDLGYGFFSNPTPGSENRPVDYNVGTWGTGTIQEGVRPGGAQLSTTLSIVDSSKVPAAAMAAVGDFNSLVCGNEAGQVLPDGSPWLPDSILGMAIHDSDASAQYNPSVQIAIRACDGTDVFNYPVTVNSGQGFYLTASIQTPARGKRARDNPANDAVANGFTDAANTLRVIPDPAAPPEVLQQLLQGLEPACTDCDFEPEFVIDVKPGDAANTISPKSKGTISVALLASEAFDPNEVDTSTLRLGKLILQKAAKGKSSCSSSEVNGDGVPDLVCKFQNEASNWQPGQTVVTLTGKLINGEAFIASDAVHLVQ